MFVENYLKLAKTIIFSVLIRISDVLKLLISGGKGENLFGETKLVVSYGTTVLRCHPRFIDIDQTEYTEMFFFRKMTVQY